MNTRDCQWVVWTVLGTASGLACVGDFKRRQETVEIGQGSPNTPDADAPEAGPAPATATRDTTTAPTSADATADADAGPDAGVYPSPPEREPECGARGQACCSSGLACAASLRCVAESCTQCASLRGLGVGSFASAISGNGALVVGGSGTPRRAYHWSATNPEQERGNFGDFQGALEGSPGEALSTNADGSIVVGQSTYGCAGVVTNPVDCPFLGEPRSFFWTTDTPMDELRDPPALDPSLPLPPWRSASSVSADGRFVTFDTGLRAFRWTRASDSYEEIVDLLEPETVLGITTKGLSADGSVVVGILAGVDGSRRAFRWLPNRTPAFEYLPALPVEDPADRQSEAWAVSANGQVVVGKSQRADLITLAARWTPEGIFPLPSLNSSSDSVAYATNADGSIIVGYVQNVTNAGFIWDAASGLRPLESVLPAALLSGWQLGAATGISADGTTIVGNGTRQGDDEAWIAVLGEDCPSP